VLQRHDLIWFAFFISGKRIYFTVCIWKAIGNMNSFHRSRAFSFLIKLAQGLDQKWQHWSISLLSKTKNLFSKRNKNGAT